MSNSTLTENTKAGDRVVVRCLNSNKLIAGTVTYSGTSSTPGCWKVHVQPDDHKHPVSPVIRAWKRRDATHFAG